MTGGIALAAYQPDTDLFRRQLTSIQNQTLADFICVISCDGNADEIASLVVELTNGDQRFMVAGYDQRVGFYRNFERALAGLPPSCEWFAFADQDDVWYPEKLATLVPYLEENHAVSGQARVVEHPSNRVLSASTGRQFRSKSAEILCNEFSGAMMVFRPEVRDLALPFPDYASPSEVHDHWVAVCASALGSIHVHDVVLQDYVQHEKNVIGELQGERFNIGRTWANVKRLTMKYEGNTSVKSVLRVVQRTGVGWREEIVRAVLDRSEGRVQSDFRLAVEGLVESSLIRRLQWGRHQLREGCPYRSVIEFEGSVVAGRLLRALDHTQ